VPHQIEHGVPRQQSSMYLKRGFHQILFTGQRVSADCSRVHSFARKPVSDTAILAYARTRRRDTLKDR
jgi:hypothetical protein